MSSKNAKPQPKLSTCIDKQCYLDS